MYIVYSFDFIVNFLFPHRHSLWSLLAGRIAAGYAIGSIHFLIPVYIHDIAQIQKIQLYNCIMLTNFAAGVLTMFITGQPVCLAIYIFPSIQPENI